MSPTLTMIASTLGLGLAVSVIAIPLGLAVARIMLCRGLVPRLLLASCICLAFVPIFMHVSAWDSAFGKLGWINRLDGWSGRFATGWAPAIWVHVAAAVPQVALAIWFWLRVSVRTYEQQAQLDAGARQVFWRITLARLWPVIALSSVWIMVTAAREIAATDIYRIGTAAEQVYLGFSLGGLDPRLEFGELNAVAVALSIAAVAAVSVPMVCFAVSRMKLPTISSEENRRELLPATTAQKLIGIFLLVILAGIPMANLIAQAGHSVRWIEDQPAAEFSIPKVGEVLLDVPARFASEFFWSCAIAVTSSVLLVALATVLAWRSIESRAWRLVLAVMIMVTCLLPGPLIGSTLVSVRTWVEWSWMHWLFDRTIFGPVVANLLFCFPLASLLVWGILQSTARDALEHARLEGASSPTRLVWIAMASNLLPLAGCLLLVLAISFGELSASHLIVPPGIDTVPRRMLGLLHAGVNDQTAALTMLAGIFPMLLAVVGWNLARARGR